jgi:hypothetical protein
MQKGKKVMMDPMLRPVPVLETQKKSTQGIERTALALARTHENLLSDLLRALHGKFSLTLDRRWLTKYFTAPLRQDLNNHKTITILKNPKTTIPKRAQHLFLNLLHGLPPETLATSSKIS